MSGCSQARQGLRKFSILRFRRTLSFGLNLLIATGFQLEHVKNRAPVMKRSRRARNCKTPSSWLTFCTCACGNHLAQLVELRPRTQVNNLRYVSALRARLIFRHLIRYGLQRALEYRAV